MDSIYFIITYHLHVSINYLPQIIIYLHFIVINFIIIHCRITNFPLVVILAKGNCIIRATLILMVIKANPH